MALLEQFICFTTDAVGLERTLRLVQSVLLVVPSVPLLLRLAAGGLSGTLSAAAAKDDDAAAALAATAAVLAGARERVNLVRRFSRMFRFVESFYGAHVLYSELMGAADAGPEKEKAAAAGTPGTKGPGRRRRLDRWLDAFARTFAGLYLLLETLTLVDALAVEGLAVWGPARARMLDVEGQRYWFLSLACSVAAALVRMASVARDVPLPPLAPADAAAIEGEKQRMAMADGGGGDDNGDAAAAAVQDERARLRRVVAIRTAQRRAWRRAVRARLALLGRRAVSDAIDLLLPGAIVGWTPLQPGTLGLAMGVTSLLTGWDVWQRCGRQVAAAKTAE